MSRRHGATVGWDWYQLVVGTRQDLSQRDIRRRCRDCGQTVFTERAYPTDIPIVCEVCFQALPAEEALGDLPADPAHITDAQLLWLCQKHGLRGPVPSALLMEAGVL